MNLNRYIGIPFIEHGRSFHGSDCWGIVYLFFKNEKNVELPLLDSYATTKDAETISQIIGEEKSNWTKTDDPQWGDVVVLNIKGVSTHVGIYLDRGKFLHAFKNTNSCIEKLSGFRWKNRIEGYFRYE